MADGRRAARKARYRPSEERAGVIAAARIAWLLTGGVWATHALVGFAEPEYWNPVTTLDFAAVWLYSAGFLTLALTATLLGRLVPTRSVRLAAIVMAIAAYLESLPDLWAKTSDVGRKAIAEAVFERIDVLGVTDFTFTLTAAAKARGWDAAFGPGVLRLERQGGRGKTSGPGKVATCRETGESTTEEGQSGRGERDSPATNDLPITMRLAAPPEPFDWLRSA